MTGQDGVFFNGEGGRWFNRNREHLLSKWEQAGNDADVVLDKFAAIYSEDMTSVAELGCSNGFRLNEIRSRFPKIRRLFGIDAGGGAVADGSRRYPGIELKHSTLAGFRTEEKFDAVIVNFVLHWIDRNTLLDSVASIDRILRDGGYLILGDFLPDSPCRRRYHHRTDEELYTYKQDYASLFLSTNLYRAIDIEIFDHDNVGSAKRYVNGQARAQCSVLYKSLKEFYPVV